MLKIIHIPKEKNPNIAYFKKLSITDKRRIDRALKDLLQSDRNGVQNDRINRY